MLRDWNPEWNPQYFMSDYSEAELSAIEAVFPNAKTYICVTFTGSRHGLDGVETIPMDSRRQKQTVYWNCFMLVHGLHLLMGQTQPSISRRQSHDSSSLKCGITILPLGSGSLQSGYQFLRQ